MRICEECGQEIKGKPVVENGEVFWHPRCWFDEEPDRYPKFKDKKEIKKFK